MGRKSKGNQSVYSAATMNICYFGDYTTFGRAQVLRLVMNEVGHKIIECHSEKKGILFYYDLYKKHQFLKGEYDIIFIGNSGPSYFLPLFARLISQKPIVWEPLFSIYENYVHDRKLASQYSLKALFYFFMDMMGCIFSHVIILDTYWNCDFFSKTFRIKREKFFRVLIGANQNIFQEEKALSDGIFEVEFHGKYIPVQGTDVIVRAAKLLEDDSCVHFTMIGGGQTYKKTRALAEELLIKNITFLPFLPQNEVCTHIKKSHVCIGLVGDVPRIEGAIPNKVYEAASVGRVSINADTRAIREVFKPGYDILVIPRGDYLALAQIIRELKDKKNARDLGKNARKTIEDKVSYLYLGKELNSALVYAMNQNGATK